MFYKFILLKVGNKVIILAIVLLLLVGVVSFLNTEMLLINLYFTSITIPVWLSFVGMLLIGMLIAGLLASANSARTRQLLKNKEKELERSETEREEVIERAKQEAEIQMELQKKEAEIQRLNEKISSNQDKDPVSVNKKVVKETPIDTQDLNNADNKIKVKETNIKIPEEKQ